MHAISKQSLFTLTPRLTHSIRMGRVLAFFWAFAAHGAMNAELEYSKEFSACAGKSGGVTVALRACTNTELQRQDQRLNRAYQTLSRSLQPANRKKWKTAQLAWIQFCDAHCELEASNAGDGTLSSLLADSCHLAMTARRASELEELLKDS